ncbi:MAG: hybrid sensor histidine kinase/response regulator [Chloroflexi bacterium]|nr:hybrid sensor histidine kinase/response regulator [Chloroflexota bacterium]
MTQTRTVLYIEDDIASQRLVERVLQSRGYRVFVASNGVDGLRIAKDERPQLILMDINLPGMNGKEITTRLRSLAHFSHTPIVALTANTSPGSRQQALAAGCSGFLTKPINVAEFPRQVEAFLEGQIEALSPEEHNEQLTIYAQSIVERLENKVTELQVANQRLRDLDKMKSDFIVLVSHELRTPLTLINGYAFLLKDKEKGFQEAGLADAAYIVQGLNQGIDRLNDIINNIISVSRIASGSLDLSINPVNLFQLTNQIINEQRKLSRERQVELLVDESLNQLPKIDGDATLLKLAIENVANNAIKFTPDSGRVTLSGRQVDHSTVAIMIKDTGVGISLEDQRRIFERFQVLGAIQHHSTSKSAFQGGGIGLGLAIAKGIIETHNGRIWVESEGYDPVHHPGSTFHILLPIKQIRP